MSTESEIREWEEYWEEVQREVDRRGIQWVGEQVEATEEPEEVLEAPDPCPTRSRDTELSIQSPSRRKRDRQLPRRRSAP
jgi:hypothetical protein